MLACNGPACPSNLQDARLPTLLATGDANYVADVLGISVASAAAMIANHQAQNGGFGSSAAGGAMPPDDNNDGIKKKNDYTDKPKQKVNSSEKGDIVRTPDSHPQDFRTIVQNGKKFYKNNNTGEIWSKSDTQHTGKQGEWKVGTGKDFPNKNHKITVDMKSGKILKIER